MQTLLDRRSFQYKTLNDAVKVLAEPFGGKLSEALVEGKTQIYYCKDPIRAMRKQNGLEMKKADFVKEYKLLGEVKSENLDDIFMVMQGELWSPEGEAMSLITDKELGHTSMSVGDMVKVKGEYFMVAMIGWTKINIA